MKISKRTVAFLACVVSLALVVTGTFAWCLQQDVTKLNKFTWEGALDQKITVDIKEDFSPWINKDVYTFNEEDSTDSAVLRLRFEEFIKVTGGAQDVEANSIFKADELKDYAADSTVAKDAITVQFSDRVITMKQWLEMNKPLTDSAGEAYWVIDTDGWIYYTTALAPGETSVRILDNVAKKSDDKNFLPSIYGGNNVKVDYNINVRLQVMSADLSSYAVSEDSDYYPRDWANKNGCEITEYNNGYDITETSKITDNADALIRAVSAAYSAE